MEMQGTDQRQDQDQEGGAVKELQEWLKENPNTVIIFSDAKIFTGRYQLNYTQFQIERFFVSNLFTKFDFAAAAAVEATTVILPSLLHQYITLKPAKENGKMNREISSILFASDAILPAHQLIGVWVHVLLLLLLLLHHGESLLLLVKEHLHCGCAASPSPSRPPFEPGSHERWPWRLPLR